MNNATTILVLGVSLAKTGFWVGGGGGAGGGENGLRGRCEPGVPEGNGPDGATMSCKTMNGGGEFPFKHSMTQS